MRRAFMIVLVVSGCTRPNPRACSDGLCSDPAFPFCDSDGALEGQPKACIAVSCAPGEVRACRGDLAIVCNDSGNNYDLVACQRGCDATHGCRACTANAECANPTPVCDDTSSDCRACSLDDECASMVCEDGSCLSETAVLYASPTGSGSSGCSLAEPCTIGHVQSVAVAAAVPPVVRILPGPYIVGITIGAPTNAPLRFVATGATIAATKSVVVENGASVEIRGLIAVGGINGVACGSTSSRTKLVISDSTIAAGQAGTVPVHLEQGCDIQLIRSEVKPGADRNAISVGDNATLTADRILVRGTNPAVIGALGGGFGLRITNSVLEDVSLLVATLGGSSTSTAYIGFNTIVLEANVTLDCQPLTNLTRVYENNIVIGTNVANSLTGASCTTVAHNILFPQHMPPATNIAVDPQFVDAAAKDRHLKPTSPAVDAALPSVLPATADFDGIRRPQGDQSDIGAYELPR